MGGGLSYTEYVIYRGEQAYPEFLITYRIVPTATATASPATNNPSSAQTTIQTNINNNIVNNLSNNGNVISPPNNLVNGQCAHHGAPSSVMTAMGISNTTAGVKTSLEQQLQLGSASAPMLSQTLLQPSCDLSVNSIGASLTGNTSNLLRPETS